MTWIHSWNEEEEAKKKHELIIIWLDLSSSSSIEHLPGLVTQTSDSRFLSNIPTNNHVSWTPIDTLRRMTCSSPMRQHDTNLTVLDVYDEAALIGKDFERIIEGKN